MAAELQALFEKIVLDFLASCQGRRPPQYGTRSTLGKLAESVSSLDNHEQKEDRIALDEPWRNGRQSSSSESSSSYRGEVRDMDKEDNDEMEDEQSSNGTSFDPLMEGSRRMMTRSQLRRRKCKLPSAELMSGDEEEDDLDDSDRDETRRRTSRRISKRRRKGGQLASKRRKVSSNSDDEEEETNYLSQQTVTRTGRTVKPTVRFS